MFTRASPFKVDIIKTSTCKLCQSFFDSYEQCTKHINVCYHHFREHVRKGLIKIFPVGTADQITDVLTKALAQNDFTRHRIHLCGN
jgi:hypothetical protein